MSQTVWMKKAALSQAEIHDYSLPVLGDGQVRLKIESFSVTANNITYAVIGDMFGYWNDLSTSSRQAFRQAYDRPFDL